MRIFKPGQLINVNTATKEELLVYNKKMQNNLIRSEKRLREGMERNPGVYSPFGLESLQGRLDDAGNREKGIPSVSKNDGINTLRATAKKMNKLHGMETTTLSGARRVQERHIKLSLGLPQTGKLTAAQMRTFKEAASEVKQNPDIMKDFWNAFQTYQNQNETRSRNLDSGRLLEEYRAVYQNAKDNGTTSFGQLHNIVVDYAKEGYNKEQLERAESQRLQEESQWR